MPVRAKKIGRDYDFDGNNIFNSSLNEDGIQFIFADIDTSTGIQTYHLVTKARYNFIINSLSLMTSSDTLQVKVKINGVQVTGLIATATTSITEATATAYNTVGIGDIVTIETVPSDPTVELTLSGNLSITRN